ncbi:unnamed protein product [Pleuronectes platessa]|uniref:Uncharacterized protein n=1 Tax=Pleuronectes platessa TaxID=8262 RepID=A0A9N7YDU0_PLEPL|nr:unnamed protein product [Pleuronectes platessa]
MASGAQCEEDVGAITKTPQHREARHRHSAAQHPLADLEINYACFHITIKPPLWGTLTPSTPYTLVFLHPPPRPIHPHAVVHVRETGRALRPQHDDSAAFITHCSALGAYAAIGY